MTERIIIGADGRKYITTEPAPVQQVGINGLTEAETDASASVMGLMNKAPVQPDQRLVNLLCRIHRDGGHYIADHGIDKAVDDADVLIAELNALRDSAPVQQGVNQQLLEALKWALEWIDAVPKGTVLPTMPGFDRDYVDTLISKAGKQ